MTNPNYAQFNVNPWAQQQAGLNNLAAAAGLHQTAERTNVFKREQDIKEMFLPIKAGQVKAAHVSSLVNSFISMPDNAMKDKYRKLIEQVVPMPIGHDSQGNPIGAGHPNFYLSPDVFDKLDPDEKRQYLKRLAYDSKSMADLDLQNVKGHQAAQKIIMDWAKELDLINERFVKEKALIEERAQYGQDGTKTLGRIEEEAAARARGTARVKGATTMADIKDEFTKLMKNSMDALRGVGAFVEDPNRAKVSQEYMQASLVAASRYIERGGKFKDLNLTDDQLILLAERIYKQPQEIVEDYNDDQLTLDQAKKILKELFPEVKISLK